MATPCSWSTTTAPQSARRAHRPRAVGAEGRHAACRLARARRHAGPVFVPILSTNRNARAARCRATAARGAVDARRPRGVVPRGRAGHRVLPLAWQNSVYFGDQNGTVYSLRATDGHVNWTYPRQGRGEGRPRARLREPVLRRLRGPRLRAESEHGPRDLGRHHQRRGLRIRIGQLLLDAGGRVRSRVHGQHRRAGVLVRARTGRSRGRLRPAHSCTPRRRSPTSPASARPCTRARTTAPSTRSTRGRARSGGGTASAAGFRARRRSWDRSCTSRISAPRIRSASTPAPGTRCSASLTARSTPSCATMGPSTWPGIRSSTR